MIISEENKIKIRKFKDILDRGLYASGKEVTDTYNDVFNTHLNVTNCSSCIRQRITQLYDELIYVEKTSMEALKNDNLDGSPQDEKKALNEQITGKKKALNKKG